MTIKESFKAAKFSVNNFIWLIVAGIINAVGVTLLLSPLELYDSGVSGLSMFLGNLTPSYLPLALFLVVINVPIFIFGFKKQGASFTIYSLFAIIMYSLIALVFQTLIPGLFPGFFDNGSPLVGDDMFLAAVFGGLLSGVGSGLTIRYGGTMDGIETLAVIFAKRINLSVGNFVLIFNVILYIIIGITYICAGMSPSGYTFQIPLYSIVAYVINGMAVDFISEGLDKAKGALIIPTPGNYAAVAEALSAEFGRGLTVLDGKGYYSKQDKKVIYCVVNRFQVARLHAIVSQYDSNAFVTVWDISDVFGTSIKNSKRLDKAQRLKAQAEKDAKIKAAVLAAANTELAANGQEPVTTNELFMNPANTSPETASPTTESADVAAPPVAGEAGQAQDSAAPVTDTPSAAPDLEAHTDNL
ncbi:MAG: YitT family protein [Clostridia bacterium]|nr:YitT family protein [Clostridia bacterium]